MSRHKLWRISLGLQVLIGGLVFLGFSTRNYQLRGEYTEIILIGSTFILSLLAIFFLLRSRLSRSIKFLLSFLQIPGLFGMAYLIGAFAVSQVFSSCEISVNSPTLLNGITIRQICFLSCVTDVYHDRFFWSKQISSEGNNRGGSCEAGSLTVKWNANETSVEVIGSGVDRSFDLTR